MAVGAKGRKDGGVKKTDDQQKKPVTAPISTRKKRPVAGRAPAKPAPPRRINSDADKKVHKPATAKVPLARTKPRARPVTLEGEFSLVPDVSRGSENKQSTGSEEAEPEPTHIYMSPQVNATFRQWGEAVADQSVNGLRKQFASLRSYIPTVCSTNAFETNRAKNRYRDVLCMDETRVVLKPGSSYIHASYVKNAPLSNYYFICCQAPLDNTTSDFWHMIWQEKTPAIIMLCNLEEGGREKSVAYWPRNKDESKSFGRFVVTNVGSRTKDFKGNEQVVSSRLTLAIKGRKGYRKIIHYMCPRWPDHGVPSLTEATLHLIKTLPAYEKQQVVVHCSAGIGRTGTFVALNYAIEMILQEKTPDCQQLLKKVREQRLHSIQTELQYLFVHRAVIDYFVNEKKQSATNKITNFIQEYDALIQHQLLVS